MMQYGKVALVRIKGTLHLAWQEMAEREPRLHQWRYSGTVRSKKMKQLYQATSSSQKLRKITNKQHIESLVAFFMRASLYVQCTLSSHTVEIFPLQFFLVSFMPCHEFAVFWYYDAALWWQRSYLLRSLLCIMIPYT